MIPLNSSDILDGIGTWDRDLWLEPFFEVMGPVFPLIIAVGLMGMLYIYTRSMAMPVVVAILIGGTFITTLPPAAQNVGILLVFAGIAGAVWMAYSDTGRI